MNTAGVNAVRSTIASFLSERLEAKLQKVKPEETDKRTQLQAQFEVENWLEDAARRVSQIQLATHTLKPLHPDARGTNLHVEPSSPSHPGIVGSHNLGNDRTDDVVGNAAALDVYKFLSLEVEGRTLLERALKRDKEFLAALSDDEGMAEEWCAAFASLPESKSRPTSHTLAKQVYFPLSDGLYHLLAPLFPTSLVHRIHLQMREERFGESAKEARKAHREKESHPNGFREYRDLAIRKFGGSKPQNISQLNSERYGENWLLASVPPTWKSAPRPPLHRTSVFDGAFGRQRHVRDITKRLRKFIEGVDYNNLAIREYRASLVEQICDQAHDFAATLRQLPPGWSASAECKLHPAERLWLDPYRAAEDETFYNDRLRGEWPSEVSHRFGNWLNQELSSKKLRMSDAEHEEWKRSLSKELAMFKEILEDDRADA